MIYQFASKEMSEQLDKVVARVRECLLFPDRLDKQPTVMEMQAMYSVVYKGYYDNDAHDNHHDGGEFRKRSLKEFLSLMGSVPSPPFSMEPTADLVRLETEVEQVRAYYTKATHLLRMVFSCTLRVQFVYWLGFSTHEDFSYKMAGIHLLPSIACVLAFAELKSNPLNGFPPGVLKAIEFIKKDENALKRLNEAVNAWKHEWCMVEVMLGREIIPDIGKLVWSKYL